MTTVKLHCNKYVNKISSFIFHSLLDTESSALCLQDLFQSRFCLRHVLPLGMGTLVNRKLRRGDNPVSSIVLGQHSNTRDLPVSHVRAAVAVVVVVIVVLWG